jgi:hypothetical protein
MRRIEDATFFFLIVAASLAFAWIERSRWRGGCGVIL